MTAAPPSQQTPLIPTGQPPAAVPSAPKTPLSVAVQPAYGHTFIVLLLSFMAALSYLTTVVGQRVSAMNARDFPASASKTEPAPTPPIAPVPAPSAKPDPATPPTGPSQAPAPPVALAVKDDANEMIGGFPKYKPGRDGARLTLGYFHNGRPVYNY